MICIWYAREEFYIHYTAAAMRTQQSVIRLNVKWHSEPTPILGEEQIWLEGDTEIEYDLYRRIFCRLSWMAFVIGEPLAGERFKNIFSAVNVLFII